MDGARAQLTVGGVNAGGDDVRGRERRVTTAAGEEPSNGTQGGDAADSLAGSAAAGRRLPVTGVDRLEEGDGGADDRSRTHALRPSAGSRIPSGPD
jgi:hypothetical protein